MKEKNGGNMLNSFTIDQYQVIKHFGDMKFEYRKRKGKKFYAKLNIADIAIFVFCRGFMLATSKSIVRKTFEGELYTWIKASLIKEQLPMLEIKSNEIIAEHVTKLVNAGLLKKKLFPVRYAGRKMKGVHLTMGHKADCLYFNNYKNKSINSPPVSGRHVHPSVDGTIENDQKQYTPVSGRDNVITCNKGEESYINKNTNKDMLEEEDISTGRSHETDNTFVNKDDIKKDKKIKKANFPDDDYFKSDMTDEDIKDDSFLDDSFTVIDDKDLIDDLDDDPFTKEED